ncbi:EAL domain-containing protein [Vibrio intestinalis]|uniref:EAL domain-containing protein n=1 Tax=Vibrio intestinalis TaxID=2933291 RepID=UPI0021A63EFA|nr:EAL domain-containing protein [Vibrio intestinalis]
MINSTFSPLISIAELDMLMGHHFMHMFDVMNDGLFYMTDTDNVIFYNPSFYQQFGIADGQILFSKWLDLIHPFDRQVLLEKVENHLDTSNEKQVTQYRVRKTNGQYVWIEGSGITKTINGQTFIIGCHRDISDAKLMETYVHQAAFRDNASGLSNSHKLSVDLSGLSLQANEQYSLIYIHLEDIRSYQSLHGPHILRDLMSHLLSSLNTFPDEFVDIYRVQSDDFAILVKGQYNEDEINNLGERILSSYRQSIEMNGYLFGTDISIGIVPNFDRALPPEEIIKIAARTGQFARAKHENYLGIYNAATKKKVDRHFHIERELAQAIKNNILSVRFQPIINAKDNTIASFEALVRWNDATLGQIYPDEFIAVAEKNGLIVDLGYLVVNKACQFIKQYQLAHNSKVRVNINVSVLQLLNNQFPDRVKMMIDEYQIDSDRIVLELTETIILDGNKSAESQLCRLNEYGFRLSLDDFGAGYSSLNSFFELPFKQIKVDKMLAWRALENPATFEYLSFITRLCSDNNVDVVIEGIENADMQRKFTKMGVHYLQGFWFAKPLCLASASQVTLV